MSLDSLKTKSTRNITITTNSILIEQDRDIYTCLLDSLIAAGYKNRIRETTDFFNLAPEEIAVVNADCTTLQEQLLIYTGQKYTKSFYLIDPYGPSGIPYDFVKPIIEQDGTDVMINFIYSDLHKKAGALKPNRIISRKQKPHVEHWTEAFGSDEWIDVVTQIEKIRSSRDAIINTLGLTQEEANNDPLINEIYTSQAITDKQLTTLKERRLVELYKDKLHQMDPSLAIKLIRLRFPDKERPMFYLFLTTHDGTGALTLNKILYEAELWESELRYIHKAVKNQLPRQHQLSMFSPEIPDTTPPPKSAPRPSVEQCAQDLYKQFVGTRLTRRDLYKQFADDVYFDKEINKAISRLKKEKKLFYTGKLTNGTEITFLTTLY